MATAPFPTDHPPLRFTGGEGDPRARLIIEASYDLLEEEGLEGLTIRAVLARTGLARRAFYDNFTGKDDLVLAVFARTIRLAADYYARLAETMADPLERLAAVVSSIAIGTANLDAMKDSDEGIHDNRSAALSREHLRLAESRPRELQAALAPLIALIADQLRAGMAAGVVRPCDADLQAGLIYNLVSTTVHSELLAGEGRPDRERRLKLAREIWEFCRRAIAA
jgi:AcrR family transcriptional regulator